MIINLPPNMRLDERYTRTERLGEGGLTRDLRQSLQSYLQRRQLRRGDQEDQGGALPGRDSPNHRPRNLNSQGPRPPKHSEAAGRG